MTATDTARLRALALAATPGPWGVDTFHDLPRYRHMPDEWKAEKRDEESRIVRGDRAYNPLLMCHKPADAAHIAACDPAQVLAMCAEIDALRAVRDAAEEVLAAEDGVGAASSKAIGSARDRMADAVEALRAALEAAGGKK